MKIVINKQTGQISSIVSKSGTPQPLMEGEEEVEVLDDLLNKEFMEGSKILYDKYTDKFYAQPKDSIDKEKLALYEAIANMNETMMAMAQEIEILKNKEVI